MTLPAPDALPAPLTAVQFQTLADVPPEIAWFANLTNPNTRRAYRQDMRDFQAFTGLRRPEEFRDVTRAHVIVWREDLTRQQLANDTIRRKLVALSSLYAYLCERHAVLHDPVLGVKAAALDEPGGRDAGDWCAPGPEAPGRAARTTPSQASATAPSWRRCSITPSAARSSARGKSGTSSSARACRICASRGRGIRCALSKPPPRPCG